MVGGGGRGDGGMVGGWEGISLKMEGGSSRRCGEGRENTYFDH